MNDITSKQITLRTAKGTGMVLCSQETLTIIKNNAIPKGNIFEIAKAAGLLAAKDTAHLIPHCHPVSIDGMKIDFEYLEEISDRNKIEPAQYGIRINAEAKSIGRTGIEMELLTGISVAALTIYDLLKPVDKNLEITGIKLHQKTGGKSGQKLYFNLPPSCAVLVCSDSTAEGKREDQSGKIIKEMLGEIKAKISDYQIVPDDKEMIQQKIKEWVKQDIQFIFTTGGTGLGPRDNTVAAVKEIIERDADGITEAMRMHGQMRTPMAMMSRSVAGSIGQTMIITLPGSSDGARQSLEAILPAVFHARKMLKGGGH
ncbi:MAG: bifunctional molybdenum cofactor biosynthesis protein MoaC/MoaB [Bacteroidota bacterium]|nr:bifunctional molybdenum cofactor biosynthesis protein MoaC/MoaB [Bacteroidota bacterium]